MLIWTTPQWPVILALRLLYRQVVDAGDTVPHVTVIVEFPVFIAVGPKPITGIVMPLVGKPDGNQITLTRPQLLDKAIVELLVPFADQKVNDGFAPCKEFHAVTPDTVW